MVAVVVAIALQVAEVRKSLAVVFQWPSLKCTMSN